MRRFRIVRTIGSGDASWPIDGVVPIEADRPTVIREWEKRGVAADRVPGMPRYRGDTTTAATADAGPVGGSATTVTRRRPAGTLVSRSRGVAVSTRATRVPPARTSTR